MANEKLKKPVPNERKKAQEAAKKKATIVESGNKSKKIDVKAVKAGIAAKKTTAMGQSAKSHQKDLAKISGQTALTNEVNRQSKAGKAEYVKSGKTYKLNAQKLTTAYNKAADKTSSTFKKSK